MAAKTSWHRCWTKLRHSHPVYNGSNKKKGLTSMPKRIDLYLGLSPSFYFDIHNVWNMHKRALI